MAALLWHEKFENKEKSPQELVDTIFLEAVRNGISDIHIEPLDGCVRVRLRRDGVLFPITELPLAELDKVIARIKIMSSLDIADKRLPQDGRFVWQDGENKVDMRVSTMPTVRGEKLVIRLLDSNQVNLSLDNLGMDVIALSILRKLIHSSKGLFILCGPTNSGKTTTLYSALRELQSTEVSIATLEDPVEYRVEGLCQSQINRKSGLLFINGLRALLRQDPDILVIGEIRDVETAEIAVQASLTGHLVFSTLHAGSAVEVPIRLMDMGIKPYLIADSLLGITSQRLARKLCVHCRSQKSENQYHHLGCKDCYFTGYSGRMSLCEVIPVGTALKKAIRNCSDTDELQHAAINDGAFLMENAIKEALLAGITDIQEVRRIYND